MKNITNTKIALLGALIAGIVIGLLGTIGWILGTYEPRMNLEDHLTNVALSSIMVSILMLAWYIIYFRMIKMKVEIKWKLVTMTGLFFCILAGLQFGLLFVIFVLALMYYANSYFNKKMGVVTFDERSEHISTLSMRRTLQAMIILLLIIIITKADLGRIYIIGLNDFAPLLLGFIILFYSFTYHYYSRKL